MMKNIEEVSDISLGTGKILPNFLFLHKSAPVANMRKTSLSAMIHQPTDS
jgi:hypothetical protein